MVFKPLCGLMYLRGTPVFVVPAAEMPERTAKRIYGMTPLKTLGGWAFPAYQPYMEDVIHDMQLACPDIEFNKPAQDHINYVRQLPNSLIRQDFEFITEPFDHQRFALEHLLRNSRAAVFYDCGIGKTKIILDLVRHENLRLLVLTPVVGLGVWLKEAGVHAKDAIAITAIQGKSRAEKTKIIESLRQSAKDPRPKVVLLGYDSAPHYYTLICDNFDYNAIVADESHGLRDFGSRRTKCALALSSRAHRRIIMSGTPSLGDPMHLYSQLSFLGRYIPAPNYMTFRRWHLIPSKYNRHIIVGYKNLDLLNERVQRIAIRKTKDECLDLPERTIIDVPFELSAEQKKQYNSMVRSMSTELESGVVYEAAHAASALQKLLQMLSGFFILPPPPVCDGCQFVKACVDQKIKPYTRHCSVHPEAYPQKVERFKNSGKLAAMEELLDDVLLEKENKVIVWCHFTEELNIIEELLKTKKVGYLRVDGSNSQHAQTLADRFNTDPAIRVYLGQIATGVGLTLTSATYMVYFGLNYSLDAYLQSMDRNYRIGQKHKVVVYRLLSEGSVLEYVAKALAAKIDLAATLTTRISCVVCPNSFKCLQTDIKPFTKGCRYKERTQRVLTKMEAL